MRSKTAKYFECTCQYLRTMEDGKQKKVKETNAVEALSFAEAEQRFFIEMEDYINCELDVTAIKIAQYKEVFFNDEDENADRWYKVSLDFITFDEKTGTEKPSRTTYLFQASSFDNAKKEVVDVMRQSMIDYVIVKIEETGLYDVFEYKKS